MSSERQHLSRPLDGLRSPALLPLFAGVGTLPGIGPRHAKALARLLPRPDGGEPRLVDLLFHMPTGVVDRSYRPSIRQAEPGRIATIRVTVERHRGPSGPNARAPFRIDVSDGTGTMTLVFFKTSKAHIDGVLPIGGMRWVSGRVEMYDGLPQIVHPDRIAPAGGAAAPDDAEPVYPLVEGVTQGLLSRAVAAALDRLFGPKGRLVNLPEWTMPGQNAGWPGFADALRRVHRPVTAGDVAPGGAARARLAHDELLAGQLALALLRAGQKRAGGRATAGGGTFAEKVQSTLPFALTGAQRRALAEIGRDLASGERMLRLLQGDVGSGKTVVALLAAAAVTECGRQTALMAPTEVLARQHFETMSRLGAPAGLRVALLTGREGAAGRRSIQEQLDSGAIDILVGTHALFQPGLAFRDLALAVVDEQHRFGVQQRLALAAKGEAVDVLLMTATPIPRTLVMTAFGDMDSSALDEKPPGRTPVDTRVIPLERLDEVTAAVGRALDAGARVYWICPLVESSEDIDLVAADERHDGLRKLFPGRVGLVHGQMRGADKDAALAAFADGSVPLLVATTVVEVGVDVPEASVMVIEHGERFGLAQLHQLRGRVGRGAARSTCLVLYRAPLGEIAAARLGILRETDDGFRIAEEDLALRGGGEILGTRQSGLPDLRLADLARDGDLLRAARADALAVASENPALSGERGQALQLLLQIFERQEAAWSIAAG